MSNKNAPSIDRLREILRYEPETGALYWLVRTPGRSRLGKMAGSLQVNGYIEISVDNRRLYAHRIAWAMMTGEWPVSMIDHANGRKSDNRWSNLREANNGLNKANAGLSKRNASGLKGVDFHRASGCWRAQIGCGDHKFYLGIFKDKDEAARAYDKKAVELFGDYARTNAMMGTIDGARA